jgi:hypothetical protein
METTTETQQAPALHAVVADTISDLVDGIVGIDRTIASLQALRARMLHEAAVLSGLSDDGERSSLGFRSLRAELACATRVPERSTERQILESESLTLMLPATLAALTAGDISYRHAQVLIDAMATLDREHAAALEAAALPFGLHLTAAKFDRTVRGLLERLAPDNAPQRHIAEVEKREVSVTPARDGMAWLTAYLPAADALGIFNRITDVARSWKHTGADAPGERTLTQRRADAFRDLLLDGEVPAGTSADGSARLPIGFGIRPKVFVTVPVLGLLGRHLPGIADEPAMLDGYGPIDMDTARELAAHAPSFIRLLTSPETGAVLSVGRDSYRVPADLKNWLAIRDGTCRFPGCSRPAAHCDVDHTDDWAFGNTTCHDNLAHLCPSHHTVKHQSAWTVEQAAAESESAPGTLVWTSPLGSTYITEPNTVMRI